MLSLPKIKDALFLTTLVMAFNVVDARADVMTQGTSCTGSGNFNSNSGILTCSGGAYVANPVTIGSTSASCASALAGQIQYTSGALQLCNGSAWSALSSSGGTSGTGTTNYVARWTSGTALGTGTLYDNGTSVGIGTTSPAGLLDVEGNTNANSYILGGNSNTGAAASSVIMASNGTENIYMQMQGTGVTNRASYFSSNSPGGLTIDVTSNAGLSFATNSTTQMVILSGGNVGIGTTAPNSKLHIAGGSVQIDNGQGYNVVTLDGTVRGAIQAVSDAGNDRIILNSNGSYNPELTFQTAAVERMRITSTGNVGIGTTAPQAILDVRGGTYNTVNIVGGIYNTLGYYVAAGQGMSWDQSLSYIHGNGTTGGTANYINFATNSSERMRIDPNGNVGIGTTSPHATLDVSGFARLKLNSSAPATCSASNEGAIALTHLAQECVCDTTPQWSVMNTSTACNW